MSSSRRKRGEGNVFRRPGSPYWYIRFCGKRISTQTTSEREARRELAKLVAAGPSAAKRARTSKATFEQLVTLIRQNYAANARRSERSLDTALLHLARHFGGWEVSDITKPAILEYRGLRLAAEAKPATINRELAALRRALNLGYDAELVQRVPSFKDVLMQEDNVRQGFVTAAQYTALLEAAEKLAARRPVTSYLAPLIRLAYITGWRRGELLSLEWSVNVDLVGGWLRLEPGTTKNRRGRMFPIDSELRSVLQELLRRKREVEIRTGRIIRHVIFKNDGTNVVEFKDAFRSTARAVRMPGLIFHDFRRSAVRNLLAAGLDRVSAKRFTGHETDAVFERYAISDEASLREAGAKYAAYRAATRPAKAQ